MPFPGTSDFPSLTVEFLSDQGPAATNGTWVDITDFTVQGTVSRGRTYQTDQFDAGTCSLILKTTTRLFDPDNTAGTYYGNLLPMRQLRITSTWSATTYNVFRGYIKSWGNTVEDNKLWTTQLTAADGFFWQALQTLPSSWLELAVLSDNPTHFYHLDESSGSTKAVDCGTSIFPINADYVGTPANGTTGIVNFDGGRTATAFSGSVYLSQNVSAHITDTASSTDYAFECWFKWSDVAASRSLMAVRGNGTIWGNVVVARSDGKISDGNLAISASTYNDGAAHHLVSNRSGQTLSIYVDNVVVATVANATASPTAWTIGIGTDWSPDTLPAIDDFSGTIQSAAVWIGTALTAQQIANHYYAGSTAFSGSDSGALIDKIAGWRGVPTSLRAIDSGSSTIGGYELTGSSVTDYFRALAQTELGQTYFDGAGTLVHNSRSTLSTQTRSRVSQAVWGDGSSTSSIQFDNDNFSFPRDETLIRNPVRAARRNGITATVSSASGITTYGTRDWAAPESLDLADVTMWDRAWYLLNRYASLPSRLESVQFTPRRDPTNLWAQVLGRKFGDRVTIARTPLGLNSQIVKDVILERVTHTFGIGPDWRTTFGGGVAELTVPLIWDDATYGKWDTATWGY